MIRNHADKMPKLLGAPEVNPHSVPPKHCRMDRPQDPADLGDQAMSNCLPDHLAHPQDVR